MSEVEDVKFDLYPFGRLPELTDEDKADDLRYRDKMMASVQGAMSDEGTRKLQHAVVRERNYAAEVSRLIGQGLQSTPQFPLALNELADALYDQGRFTTARTILEAYDPQHPRIPHLARLQQAIDRPDDEHCQCPPTDKLTRRVYSRERGKYIDHLICAACGHENATELLPQEFKDLKTATGIAPAGSPDTVVFGHAERLRQ